MTISQPHMDQQRGQKSSPTLLIVVAAVAVIGVGIGMYFLVKSTNDNTNRDAANSAVANRAVTTNTPGGSGSAGNTNTAADSLYVGDDFTVIQMAGWIRGQISGTLVSFQNNNETHAAGSAAAKINFKSYIAVSFDNTNGQTLDQVYQTTIDSITSSIPSTNAFATSDETVNGLPAKFVAMEFNRQDVDYTVLVTVYLADGKYYIMSFNTTTEKWTEQKDKFYEVARSFKLKI